MNAIIGYIISMMPYMVLTIPVYLIVRRSIIKSKNIKINWYHEISLFVFVIFLVGLASQTIIPEIQFNLSGYNIVYDRVHTTNLKPFLVIYQTYIEVFRYGNINYFLINFLGNIIMFMPIGFFIPLLWRTSNKKVVLIGFCSSLFVEVSQLFLARGTDVDDLILNTFGVWLGLMLYRGLYKEYEEFMIKFVLAEE